MDDDARDGINMVMIRTALVTYVAGVVVFAVTRVPDPLGYMFIVTGIVLTIWWLVRRTPKTPQQDSDDEWTQGDTRFPPLRDDD